MSISAYLDQYFPQFEPALKEIIADNCTLKSVPAGEKLIQTGQQMRATMLVVEGRLKLYREGEEGGEVFMYYLEPGTACALSMICAQKQETSEVMAKALEDSLVLMIPVALMGTMMQDYKSWYNFVVETYRSRFEELLNLLDQVVFRAMDQRLVSYLENQREKLKTTQLYITHSEIATDLNSSREVISRLLKKLEQQDKVKLFRNYIELL
ncbi:Crp/Fnr family transcriptional regulator [Chitinophaga sp. MM2321]|uniref:Crp/Fnr family transcriptional regulator n=1 Tax=Chitinophaga sp. MM2321 TaxID=3137178 RepID=UPI0032D58756